jgi:5-methylcytosine-specific restriction endonuclease McrA
MSILVRDGYKCRYCGVSITNDTANMEHRIPWKYGGKTNSDNLVTSCRSCNKAKGNKRQRALPLPRR